MDLGTTCNCGLRSFALVTQRGLLVPEPWFLCLQSLAVTAHVPPNCLGLCALLCEWSSYDDSTDPGGGMCTQVPIHCGHCYTTQEMLPYRVPSEKVLSLGRPGWHVFPCSPAGTLSCWSPAGRMKPLYSSTPSGHCSGWGEPCVPYRLDLGMPGKASWLAGHVVQGVAVSAQVWWALQLQAWRNS